MGFEKCEFNRIVGRDLYQVKRFPQNYLDFIFDIGAFRGIFSVFMRMLHPSTPIISLEPSVNSFATLWENTRGLDIAVNNIALADGKELHFKSRGFDINNYFTKEGDGYIVNSITLVDLFKKYKCTNNHKYLIKLDCEGGEKYLIGDSEAEKILKGAEQISTELHFKSPRTPFEEWLTWEDYKEWINDVFSATHSIEFYRYSQKNGIVHCCLKSLKPLAT